MVGFRRACEERETKKNNGERKKKKRDSERERKGGREIEEVNEEVKILPSSGGRENAFLRRDFFPTFSYSCVVRTDETRRGCV